MKKCTRCLKSLELCEFRNDKYRKDGLSAACRECLSVEAKNRRDKKSPEELEIIRERTRKWRAKNPEYHTKKALEFREENPDYAKQKSKEFRENNPEWRFEYYCENRERIIQYNLEYVKNNKHIGRTIINKRRVSKKGSRILQEVFHNEIKCVYKKCQDKIEYTNKIHHVDHIIPLTHKNVCGLHVPWNLQILPAAENCSKNNKFDGTYENESWRLLFNKTFGVSKPT